MILLSRPVTGKQIDEALEVKRPKAATEQVGAACPLLLQKTLVLLRRPPQGPPSLLGWVGPVGQEARVSLEDGTQGGLGLSQG